MDTELWTIEDVPACFARVAEIADRHGYIATLFGSTVKEGKGRDLDVMMVSRFGESQDWVHFLAEFGGVLKALYRRRDRSNHSYEIAREGKLYHFVFGRF